jgi:hypothetical protein
MGSTKIMLIKMSWKIKPYLAVNLRESVEIVVRLVISPTNENRGNHNGGNNGNLNTAMYCTYCHKTGHVKKLLILVIPRFLVKLR